MSNTLEIETSDVIFLMDTFKVLGQAIGDADREEVEELLVEAEGILNRAMAVTYKDDEVIREARYVLERSA